MNDQSFAAAPGSKTMFWGSLIAIGLITLLPLGIVSLVLRGGPVVFTVGAGGLTIDGDLYGRTIPLDRLNVGEARMLDLNAEPGLKPTRRRNGTGLPGYRAGWFTLRNGAKGLLFLSEMPKAIVIPMNDNVQLMVSPDRPDEFLSAIKRPDAEPRRFDLATTGSSTPGTPPGLRWFRLAMIGITIGTAGLLIGIGRSARRLRFELVEEGLKIRGDMYGRTIPRVDLRVDEARIVNLKQGPDRLNLIRSNGVGLPGYNSGWHRSLSGWSSYLVFLTDVSRVVRIPTTQGYTLLLSPADPEGLLQGLQYK